MTNHLFTLLVLSLSSLMVSCNLFNDVCGPSIHCNVTAGLICDSGRCACMSKSISQINFNLTWDATRSICVGNDGSACVGTRDSPVLEGMKQVECIEQHSCIQVDKAPRSLGKCKKTPGVFLHGGACTPAGDRATNLQFCDASLGLFCGPNNICTCSKERLNTSPAYNLVWNEERGKCVGEIDSGCFGTKENPVPSGQKMVECVPEAVCTQADGKTPGVGSCQKAAGNSVGRLRNNMITIGSFVLFYFAQYLFV